MPISSRPSNCSLRSAPTVPEHRNFGTVTSDSVNIAMSGAFQMDGFHWDGTQDKLRYLGCFDEYTKATALKDDQAVASLVWHLKGLVRLWYEAQSTRPESVN